MILDVFSTLGFFVGQGMVDGALLSSAVHRKQLDTMMGFAAKDNDKLSKASVELMKKLKQTIGDGSKTKAACQRALAVYKI